MNDAKYWTESWNPVRGCTPVGAGCAGCWAARQASRFGETLPAWRGLARDGKWTGEVRFDAATLAAPLHWRKPRVVAVCWMGDLFHERVTDEQIAAVYGVMAACPQHTFLVLTKRAERRRAWFDDVSDRGLLHGGRHDDVIAEAAESVLGYSAIGIEIDWPAFSWPLPNVWEGVSIEDQPTADARLPDALATPAAHWWLSLEPLLGKVDLRAWLRREHFECPSCGNHVRVDEDGCCATCGLDCVVATCECVGLDVRRRPKQFDGVIVGAESGPRARPCEESWVRDVVEQCKRAVVPAFAKQLHIGGRLVTDPAEFPADLRECRATPWRKP